MKLKFLMSVAAVAVEVSARLESVGDSQKGQNLIPALRRREAAQDGAVVSGFAQEGGFIGH